MEQFAIDTITRLTQSDKVRNNISEYINKGKLPWEE
jgi:hypothetical protein